MDYPILFQLVVSGLALSVAMFGRMTLSRSLILMSCAALVLMTV